MPGRRPVDVEAVRSLPNPGVAVRRAEEEHHARVGRDAVLADLDVVHSGPEEDLDR
jgi:hypothetical protein